MDRNRCPSQGRRSRHFSALYRTLTRLGSVDTVTDEGALVIEQHGYDAFGAPRSASWEDNGLQFHSSEYGSEATTRGFTMHEHLDQHRLIHMNGRAYDPGLGRFLSVDPFITFRRTARA